MKKLKIRMANDNGYIDDSTIIVGIIAAVVLVVIAIAVAFPSYSKETTATVTICGKESVQQDSGHEYRVYTTAGTYVVKDHLINGVRTTSADTYGKIQPNKVYTVTSYGWRNGFLSMFPNILSAKNVNTPPPAGVCD